MNIRINYSDDLATNYVNTESYSFCLQASTKHIFVHVTLYHHLKVALRTEKLFPFFRVHETREKMNTN